MEWDRILEGLRNCEDSLAHDIAVFGFAVLYPNSAIFGWRYEAGCIRSGSAEKVWEI